MRKEEMFEELKEKILKSLQVENRVAIGITENNYRKKDGTQIPLEVQSQIDKIYAILNEISLRYNISTQRLGRLIEDAQREMKEIVSKDYKGKVEEQFGKVSMVLKEIERELGEKGKINQTEGSIKLGQAIDSENKNKEIRENTVKALNEKVNIIRREMQKAFYERFLEPRRFKEMQEEIEITLRNLKTGDGIEGALLQEDQFTKERIIGELQRYSIDINKTQHQLFSERYQQPVPQLSPNRSDISKEKDRETEERGIMSLPEDVIY